MKRFSNLVGLLVVFGLFAIGCESITDSVKHSPDDISAPVGATGGFYGTMSSHCDATVSPGGSIQDAIDAASDGETICVEAGTYQEDILIHAKNDLTLKGAKAGIPAGPDAVPDNRGADESIILGVAPSDGGSTLAVVEIGAATGFLLDGFTISAQSAQGQSAVFVRGSGHIIRNNIMEGDTFGPPSTTLFPSGVRSQSFSDVLVEHNNIQTFRYGMNLDGGPGDQQSTVHGNYVSGTLASSIFFQGSGADGHIATNNLVENGNIGFVLPQGEHLIQGNTVQNNSSAGIWLVNSARTKDVEILGNRLFNNAWGIYQSSGVAGVNFAHGNCIEGNGVGVQNDDSNHRLDATNNWWGAADGPSGNGPGSGDIVQGNVDFEPWLSGGCPLDPAPADPQTMEDCKNGGWADFGFRNQGQCIRFVNTGQDSR